MINYNNNMTINIFSTNLTLPDYAGNVLPRLDRMVNKGHIWMADK